MKKTGVVWKIYFIVFSAYILQNAADILLPKSFLYIYYHTLMAFHTLFAIQYILALAQIFFNILNLIALFLFVFRTFFLSPQVWQWLLILRFIFDLTGHIGEFATVSAIFHAREDWFLSTIIFNFIMVIPSYAACFQYAFRWEKYWKGTRP